MFTKSQIITFWLFLGCLSCASPEKQKAEHIEKAIAYQKSDQFEPAILELKSAIQLDPRDLNARHHLARAYRALGDAVSLQAARFHLELAVDGGVTDPAARLDLAELHLLFGDARRALEQANACLTDNPSNARGMLVRGKSYLAIGDISSAEVDLERAASLLTESADPFVSLTEFNILRGRYPAAQANLDKALALDSKNFKAHSLQGDLHALDKRTSDAEHAYKRALEFAPVESTTYLKLANFYVAQSRLNDAEAVYQKFVAAKPKEAGPLVALANLQRQRGDYEKATEVLQSALTLEPKSDAVRDQLLAVRLRSDDAQTLKQELTRLAEEHSGDALISYYQAQFELREHNFDEGIRLLRLLVQKDPQSGPAQLSLAKALLGVGEQAEALKILKVATNIGGVAVDASALMSEVYSSNNDSASAIAESRRSYELNRRSRVAIMAYGNALSRSGQLDKSRKLFEQAVVDKPEDALLRFHLGLVAKAKRDTDFALVHFEKALALAPELTTALNEIADTLDRQGNIDLALERVEKQIALVPNLPAYHELLGKLLQRDGETARAIAAFQEAIKLGDGVSDSHRQLAMLHVEKRQSKSLRQELEAMLEQEPRNLDAHAILALLAHLEQNLTVAREHYEAALKLSPGSGLLANNLANILSEEPKELERALRLGKVAYFAMPGDAHVLDTLGWLYYKKKDYERARSLLSTAARRAPGDHEIQYHYGMALAENTSDKAHSREILERVAKSNPKFARESGLRATLSAL